MSAGPHVAVVGGGIAGLAAAATLVEAGARVTLFEAQAYLGGRAASWPDRLDDGTPFDMERGFHAFFRNYANLRNLLRRVDPALRHLVDAGDYPLLGPGGETESFRGLPRRPPWNVAALALRTPSLRGKDLLRVHVPTALQMLAFHPRRTYARFDDYSARAYLDALRFPPRARQMLFDVFAHSFFNREEELSAAELLAMFHFYFTGNPHGLVFDVCARPMGEAYWAPLGRWLRERGADVRTGGAVAQVRCAGPADPGAAGPTFQVRATGEGGGVVTADALVLALAVPALRELVGRSPDLRPLAPSVQHLRAAPPFAVQRLWLDTPLRPERPPFAGTTGMGILDNISRYDAFQDESAAWAQGQGGAVVELHAYALDPGAAADPAALGAALRQGLRACYPETARARILHERLLVAADCTAFPPGSHRTRPGVRTPLPRVALAGDFVRLDMPSALMERAATSGMLAAAAVLRPRAAAPVHLPIAVPALRGPLAALQPGRAGLPDPVALKTGPGDGPPEDPMTRPTPDRLRTFGRPPAGQAPPVSTAPDWAQANPGWIDGALQRALARPAGGWYVVGSARDVGAAPRRSRIAGRDLVVWRGPGGPHAGPDRCPHMGAALSAGRVQGDCLVCPWHGLRLGGAAHGAWAELPVHDDGVLLWVRLPDGEEPLDAPVLPKRPDRFIAGVMRRTAACAPEDVIANRLDPWHGVHYHPYAFGRLRVIDREDDAVTVRVVYRVARRLGVEVDARFTCPDPRTIVMTIVGGEGEGSVVETHATPITAGRTAVVEATLATSDRPGFAVALRAAPLIRRAIERAAHRLWVDDGAYAERRHQLRSGDDGWG